MMNFIKDFCFYIKEGFGIRKSWSMALKTYRHRNKYLEKLGEQMKYRIKYWVPTEKGGYWELTGLIENRVNAEKLAERFDVYEIIEDEDGETINE